MGARDDSSHIELAPLYAATLLGTSTAHHKVSRILLVLFVIVVGVLWLGGMRS